MATPLFSFTTLNGSDPAGHDSINVLVKSIEDQLASVSSGLSTGADAPGSVTTGQVLRWSGTSYVNALVNAASLDTGAVTESKIASSAVTTDKIAADAVTLGTKTSGNYVATITGTASQIASSAATSGEGTTHTLSLVSSATLPGTPTVASAPVFNSGSIVSDTKIVDSTYVNAALSYATTGGVTLGGEVTGATNNNVVANNVIDYDNLVASLKALLVPTGSVSAFAGLAASVPTGWLVCDGRSYVASGASAALQTLLNAAGFTALPNLSGKVIAGVGTILGSARTVGAPVGAETLPEHFHSIEHDHASFDVTSGGHEHTYGINAQTSAYQGSPAANLLRFADTNATLGNTTGSTSGGGAHTHAINVPNYTGNSGPTGTGTHGVVQPTIVLNYIIKN